MRLRTGILTEQRAINSKVNADGMETAVMLKIQRSLRTGSDGAVPEKVRDKFGMEGKGLGRSS